MGSACELECETILSFDLGFVTEAVQDQILVSVREIKRMLSGLIQRLSPKNPGAGKPTTARRPADRAAL